MTQHAIPPSRRPRPTRRVSRSYPELAYPWPPAVAKALPFTFVDSRRGIEVCASDLASAEFCATLDADVRAAITRTLELHLATVLADPSAHAWISRLVFLWTPEHIAHFSSAAQKRLASAGMLDATGPVEAAKLIPTCVRTFGDMVALLEVLQEPLSSTAKHRYQRLPITTSPASSRRRVQTNAQKLIAPQKWRPDPEDPITLRFESGVEIHHDDPRFSWWIYLLVNSSPRTAAPIARTLDAEAFLNACEAHCPPHLASVARALRAGVLDAASFTVQQEIEDIALAVGRSCRDRARTASQICHRYGTDGTTRSLEDVSQLYKVSRQVIFKQIQLSRALCTRSAYAPALRAIVTAVEQHAGRPLDVVERELRLALGPTLSLSGALQFADDFLGLRPAAHVHRMELLPVEAQLPGSTHRRFVGPAAAARAHALLWELQARLRTSGFALANDVLAAASSSDGTEPPATRQQLHDALATAQGVSWLDADHQWLVWLGPASPAVSALRLLLSVSHPYPLSLDVAAEALRCFLESTPALAHPPASAIRTALHDLATAAGATLNREAIVLREASAPTTRMTATQQHVFHALATLGGYATLDALRSTCKSAQGRTTPEFLEVLRSCFFVASWGAGYKLVGWPQPSGQLQTPPDVPGRQRSYSVNGPTVRITLTQSSAERVRSADRLLYLPRPLDTLIDGTFSDATSRWPDIKAANGRLYRLAPLAQALGVPDGSCFDLEINLDSRSYRLHVGSSSGATTAR